MSEVMIDLETLGTDNDAVILSIGAVRFETYPFTVLETMHYALDTKSQEDRGRRVSAGTVLWWLKQSKEAQENLVKLKPLDPVFVLGALKGFCTNVQGIWGNGAMFDNALVGSLAKSFNFGAVWSYKQDRCYRTLKSLYDHQIALPWREGVQHNALDDSLYQAEHLSLILQEMGK